MKTYTALFTDFLPRLTAASFDQYEVRTLTIINRVAAYAVRVRNLTQ